MKKKNKKIKEKALKKDEYLNWDDPKLKGYGHRLKGKDHSGKK